MSDHTDRPSVETTSARDYLSAIVDSSEDAILSKDPQGVIQSWNRAAERLYGYSAREAIGQSIMIIVPAERQAEEHEVLRRILAGETLRGFETVRQRKDGSLVAVSLTVSPIIDASGKIIGASKIARDITEQQRITEALAEAESRQRDLQERLSLMLSASGMLLGSPNVDAVLQNTLRLARELVHASAGAIWRLDAVQRRWHVAASSGVSEAFTKRNISSHEDAPAAALNFARPLMVADVESDPMLRDQVAAYRHEGIRSMLVTPLVIAGRGTGTLVWYFKTPHEFTDVENQTASALGNLVAAAITNAELYEEQARRSEHSQFLAEVAAALASSLDYSVTLRNVARMAVPKLADWCLVHIVNEDGSVERMATTHADPAKVELAERVQREYPEDPKAAGGIHEVIRSGRPQLVTRITDEMLERSARDERHLEYLRSLRPSSFLCVPLNARGRTFGALTFLMAESGRHYDEGDARFAEDIAFRAALAVDNARSFHQAYEANQAKDEFLAVLSHELRTPLNAVLGWSRMLRTGAVPLDRIAKALEVIERNATAQLRLVEDLLDVSRIVSGKFRLDVQPVDLPAVIQEAIESVQPAADAKGIRLRVVLDSSAGPVYGDAARLQQAVWNLASNAIKFTPKDGKVEVMLMRINSHVEVVVSDTGEGIQPDALPYVFDRFRQAQSGAARRHAGLGLGLAIVRQVVELHGGTVRVESGGEGQGTTFRILLPVMLANRPELRRQGRRHPAVSEPSEVSTIDLPAIDGIRLLVVDDAEDARELLRELLTAHGAEVTAVSSAEEALDQFDRRPPDLLISDIEMPGQDGFSLVRAVRARPAVLGGSVPAIALTAYARPEDRSRSLLSGFQVHLAKPVDLSELLATISSLTGRLGR